MPPIRIFRNLRRPTLRNFLKSLYFLKLSLHAFKLPRLSLPGLRLSPPVRRAVTFSVLLTIILSSLFTYQYLFKDLPSPGSLSSQALPQTTHIRDRNGTELYKIYSGQNRTLVRLSEMPPYVIQATLSIEDKDFYHHRGFSPNGILRSLIQNIKCKMTNDKCVNPLQGGSTITQQLVKTALLSPERTLRRKIRELVLSLAVENRYSKDEILEMYLNQVGYGGAAYGIEEAAQTYFSKPAKNLNFAEATLLAGLPASPTTYSPFGIYPEKAIARQQEVLRRMTEDGLITCEQAEATAAYQLKFRPPVGNLKAPHFVMYVKDLLARKYGTDIVEQGGLDVTTSLDYELQEEIEKIVASETEKIARLNVKNGAALVTNPGTGEILAMVGSRDYFDQENDGQVNVTLALRQPGSSIKPVNYALALSRNFNPASVIEDSPVTYRIPGSPPYTPVNYDGRLHGRVTLRTALGSSYNIPAVKLLAANGVPNMIELGRKMGITTWDESGRFGLSLTLGGGEVTMLDMSVLYGVFANQGQRVDLHPVLSVRDSKGNLLEKFSCPDSDVESTSCSGTRVLDPLVAFLISDILSDNRARTPAFGPRSQLYIPGSPVAVKTGTTNNLRDNWTIGFTPDHLVAVWVGNNDNTPMSYVASGVTGASPIWRAVTDLLLKKLPFTGFAPPVGLNKVAICALTGQLSCSACPTSYEYFLPGTEPKSACSEETFKHLAKDGKANVDNLLEGLSTESVTLPTPVRGNPLRKPNRSR